MPNVPNKSNILEDYQYYMKLKQIFIGLLCGKIRLADYFSVQFTKEYISNLPSTYASRWQMFEHKYDDIEEVTDKYPPNDHYLEVFNDAVKYLISKNYMNTIMYKFIDDYGKNLKTSQTSQEIYDSIMSDNKDNPFMEIFLMSVDQIENIYFPQNIKLKKHEYECDGEDIIYYYNTNDYNNDGDIVIYDNNTIFDKDMCDYDYRDLIKIASEYYYSYEDMYQIFTFVLKYKKAIEILSDITSDENFDYINDICISDIIWHIKNDTCKMSVLHIIENSNEILESFEPFKVFISKEDFSSCMKKLGIKFIKDKICSYYNDPKLLYCLIKRESS